MPIALFSVTDKAGVADFARSLAQLGWRFLASGGTAAHLREAGLEVREISDLTGAPEILGGRVKTLHPAIYAGILSRRTDADRAELAPFEWGPIDLVVVNLYPFSQTLDSRPDLTPEEAVELIDIGGVTLLRAAAKNWNHVTVVCHPGDYASVLENPESPELRRQLAAKAFAHTARYDQAIAAYFTEAPPPPPSHLIQTLRYGENPHQKARLYGRWPDQGPLGASVLRGKELSYNNLLDLDGAWRAANGFAAAAGDHAAAVAVVKHLSPCGLACADDAASAVRAAIDSDPISAFGGIIATNRTVDEGFVKELGPLFLECLAAPDFTDEALRALAPRKNLRLLQMHPLPPEIGEYRSVHGGLLWQERDPGHIDDSQWKVVTERVPSLAERDSLRFAWIACQHVRSNAIVLARGRSTVGIGGGQPNRVDSVRIALQRAGERSRGAILASDAFFPFADSLQAAAEAGVTAVIQPGGSIRDQESIELANQKGLAMIFTGRRHFRH